MILQNGDKRRTKFLKGGNVLKKMRNVGGGGKGLMAGGIVFSSLASFSRPRAC